MTKAELATLLQSVRRSHYDIQAGIAMFLGQHPSVEMTPWDYGAAVCVGRMVYPSIKGLVKGPFPVYKDKPFFDARLWESEDQQAWEAKMRTL